MPFPREDEFWNQVRLFLEQTVNPLDAILAPNEFLEFFSGTYHYNVTYTLPPQHFDHVVFHKAMLEEIELPFILDVLRQFQAVFANEVFAVYSKTAIATPAKDDLIHVEALEAQVAEMVQSQGMAVLPERTAIAVTTYNRPRVLARSLPQLVQLGVPVVVVDDASTPENHQQIRQITAEYNVPLIRIPENRGLPNAMNTAIGYWLADPEIAWISYFQDDVDVNPDLLTILEKIQDADKRPLLTGRDAIEHLTVATDVIAGYEVLYKRSMPGLHLHAHRNYWKAVLPIPTPYLGAPKPDRGKPGQGADEDWWITAWSPASMTKRGGYVTCVPGLVRTFVARAEQSTWGNAGDEAQPGDQLVVNAGAIAPDADAPAGPSFLELHPELSLKDVRVLVDGYNLGLTQGTGIKTYGTSLVRTLKLMEAVVDVLLNRNSSRTSAVLDEILFFDEQGKVPNKLAEWVNLAKGLVRSKAGLYQAKRRPALSELVIKQGKFSDDFLEYAQSYNLARCYEMANTLFKYLRQDTEIRTSEKVDIWHATYPLPIQVRGARKITTVHDLIPLRLPYTTLDNKEMFYDIVKSALKHSAVTITVSKNSKKDLLTFYDEVDPDRIVVTYQPPVLEPLEASEEEISQYLQRYKLQYQNYLLFVGAIEPKKNVGRILEAYAGLDTDMPLVIVGRKAWSYEEELGKLAYLLDADAKQEVKLLEYVPANALRYLYRGAYCFVFPSLYEGFGLPPVEAMSFGCPVITSNASCLPEVCGDAALYVDPYDVADLRAKMEELLSDRPQRDQLARRGLKNAEFFSVENYAKRLHGAYIKALEQ